jgi:hypothetical protein
MMSIWKSLPLWALCAMAVVMAGCGNRRSDLLIVASADCQGYLDPCG